MKKTDMTYLSMLQGSLNEACERVTVLFDGAQEAFDSRSEKWQESEKGDEMQERISHLETITTNLEDAIIALEELTGNFEFEK